MEDLSSTNEDELRITKINDWPQQQSVTVDEATLIQQQVGTMERSVAGSPGRQADSSDVGRVSRIRGSRDPAAFTQRRTQDHSIVPKEKSLRFSFENEGSESRSFEAAGS